MSPPRPTRPTTMTTDDIDLIAQVRTIVDANAYMTIATADADGTPWASPVWFAHDDLSAFLWVSRPERRHSANVAQRPAVGIAIFDSTVPVGDGAAVFAEATAHEVSSADLDAAVAVFTAQSATQGAGTWTAADLSGDAPFRLYRARVDALYVLDEHEHRVPVTLDRSRPAW